MRRKIKFMVTLLLVLCCFVSIGNIAYAATQEENNQITLYSTRAVHSFGPGRNQPVGSFTFEDNNWTPTKSIYGFPTTRRFYFNGYFRKADTYNGLVQLNLKVKRVSTGEIIFSKSFYPDSNGEGLFATDVFWADSNGFDQVQLYFDASTYNTTPPGPYRKLFISYDCSVY